MKTSHEEFEPRDDSKIERIFSKNSNWFSQIDWKILKDQKNFLKKSSSQVTQLSFLSYIYIYIYIYKEYKDDKLEDN